jgi:hypothetical protein
MKNLKTPKAKFHSEVCGANLCGLNPQVRAWKDLGNPISMTFNEAIQGCCNDCYFIAALSSVAWAANGELDFWDTYYFNGQKTTLPHQEVPVDINNNPVYARLPSSGDTWAMLYEVAYAKWKSDNATNYPDIAGKIGQGGSGFEAMKEITGYQYPAQAYDTQNQSTDTIWGNISTGAVITKEYNGIKYDTYKTTNPSFAETKAEFTEITGIYKGHTYSLFGKIEDKSTKKKYIVLRNPYASQKPEPTADTIKPVISFFGVNLSTVNDGVFAFEISKFKNYFAKYGSVQKI